MDNDHVQKPLRSVRRNGTSTIPRLLIFGNGWVVRECYKPAAALLGLNSIEIIDFPDNASPEDAVRLSCNALRVPSGLVIVATPNASHWRLAMAAHEAGAIVLCEKPLMLPSQCDSLKEQEVPSDRFFVSTPNRLRPDVGRLLDLCRCGTVGRMVSIRASWRRRRGVPRPGSWYTHTQAAGGGALIDLGPHVLDIVLLAAGWPQTHTLSVEICKNATLSRNAAEWMPKGWGSGPISDVESSVCASLATQRPNFRIDLTLSWIDTVDFDETCIDIVGHLGSLKLETLFGFAPGPRTSTLLVTTCHGISRQEFTLRRDPAEDFARLMCAALQGYGCGTARDGFKVMRAISAIYGAVKSMPSSRTSPGKE